MAIASLVDTLGTIGIIVFTAGFAAVGLIRKSRTFLVIAGGNTMAFLVAGVVEGIVAAVVVIAALALTWVALFQEPDRLARRLGLVRSSAEHEFDTAITGIVDRFNDVLERARESRPTGSTREHLRSQAATETGALRALRPPDSSWAEVAQTISEAMEVHLHGWGEPLSDEQRTRVIELAKRADARRAELRAAYRSRDASLFRWP